jgi:hypothetical protein
VTLGEYFARAGRTPWWWGGDDCCTFLADWALERGHPDPMAFIRGRYRSESGALRRIREGGGLVALATRGFADIGIPVWTGPAQDGFGGVIERETEDRGADVACGIYSAGRWVTRGVRGLIVAPAVALATWEL